MPDKTFDAVVEAVRRRPGMHIGSTDFRGLHHLIFEIVDNSTDEAVAGCCDKVEVTICQEGQVRVEDKGASALDGSSKA